MKFLPVKQTPKVQYDESILAKLDGRGEASLRKSHIAFVMHPQHFICSTGDIFCSSHEIVCLSNIDSPFN
jgi:hypothetical protein